MYQIEYKAYHESLKNRDGRTGTSTQALPMHPGDLKVIFAWLDSPVAVRDLGEQRILYFKAFATTAFTLWTRCVSLNFIFLVFVLLDPIVGTMS